MTEKYRDIIGLPRHISKKRSPMPIANRAAQFAPFAALTGHDGAVKETARITQERVELDIYIKEKINEKLQNLIEKLKEFPTVEITSFYPDEKKDGGAYITDTGTVKKIDKDNRLIVMTDGTEIDIDEIVDIQGEMF